MLAVEPRIKAGISFVGGLDNVRWMLEIDPFNFVTWVRTPVLMLASRFDPRFPFETSQKPMYELAGAPAQDKALVVYDGSHYMPIDMVARESLAWLDRSWVQHSAGSWRGVWDLRRGRSLGAAIGEATALPLGVHLGGGKRGSLGLELLASAGIAALGGAVAVATSEPAWLIPVPIFQLWAVTVMERR